MGYNESNYAPRNNKDDEGYLEYGTNCWKEMSYNRKYDNYFSNGYQDEFDYLFSEENIEETFSDMEVYMYTSLYQDEFDYDDTCPRKELRENGFEIEDLENYIILN